METLRLTFGNGKYVMVMGGNIETGTYKFDSSSYPFHLTIKPGGGKNKGQTRHGSFKLLEKERLMFVLATNSTARPTRFLSTSENETMLAVYRKK